MQRAATHGAKLSENLTSLHASKANFDYELKPTSSGYVYSVANGTGRTSSTLEWAMGAGDLGQTFVYQQGEHWYQSRLSLYTNAPALDTTTGLRVDPNADLPSALGEVLTTVEVRHCFSCHTVHATTTRGFDPLHAEAGLGCEACHGPGTRHVQQISNRTQASKSNGRLQDFAIFNPAKLSPAESIDFCGSCHRTSADVLGSINQANDASVVRFQPYRLEKSRCWRATGDARLTCVACHDPHEPLNRNTVAYDARCTTCHRVADASKPSMHNARLCPVAKTNCVSCHMPKVAIASMHGEFTDHFIRSVKSGQGFTP
jgi:hypothetical protein